VNPLQGPRPHTHSDLIINKHTEQVKKLGWIIMACIDLPAASENSYTVKSNDLTTLAFKKKIPDTPTKTG